MNRALLLARRFVAAREFGVRFLGVSHTPVPQWAILNGKRRALAVPDPTILEDVLNVWLDDEYGLLKVAGPIHTVIDIGANIGLFSLLARHRFPDAVIHAYEPDTTAQRYATSNLADSGVVLFAQGVAACAGQGEIVPHGSTRLNQIVVVESDGVPLTAIATVIERVGGRVDLLKIDCEGFEWDIFTDEAAFRNVRTIRMEYHLTEGRTLQALYAVADRLGYAIVHIDENVGFGIAWLDRM